MKNFMDIREHNFLRTAVIIPAVHLANPMTNAKAHFQELKRVYKKGAMYAVAPELGLTGYSCGDLFHQETLQTAALEALAWLIGKTKKLNLVVSVGLPLAIDGALYNCAVTFYKGRILMVVPKIYPPEYREFYELRHFARATEALVREITLLGQTVAFGTDILVRFLDFPAFVLFTTICEDDWVPASRGNDAALAGSTVQANLSASNITLGKSNFRHRMVQMLSALRNSLILYSAAGQGESTADVSWDGDGIIAERDTILAVSQRFQRGGHHIMADSDLLLLTLERQRQSSFKQNAADKRPEFRSVLVSGKLGIAKAEVYGQFFRPISKHPFVPSDKASLDERCEEVFMIQSSGLAQRLLSLPETQRKIFIGLSGGLDSTISLLVAVRAMDELGLPRQDIRAYTMPGYGTSERTLKNALALAQAFGVTIKTLPITGLSAHLMHQADFPLDLENQDAVALRQRLISSLEALSLENLGGKKLLDVIFDAANFEKFYPQNANVSFENAQAWSRFMTLLMNAAEGKGIVLGTGDLTEIMLGWCTMFADHSSHYNPNSGTPKTLIRFIVGWAAYRIFGAEEAVKTVLTDILDTPISPELLPTFGGQMVQLTEDILGPLELHDFFGYYFWRFGFGPQRVARMAQAAYEAQYDLAEIKRVMKIHLVRFFASQYKRDCSPNGLKAGLLALSPRGDWRMPPDAQVQAWIAELELVPDNH